MGSYVAVIRYREKGPGAEWMTSCSLCPHPLDGSLVELHIEAKKGIQGGSRVCREPIQVSLVSDLVPDLHFPLSSQGHLAADKAA